MKLKKLISLALTASMISPFFPGKSQVYAQEKLNTPKEINLALDKDVTASAEYSTMPKTYLTDGDENTRWSTEKKPTQWAYIDLGDKYEFNKFRAVWESDAEHAANYNIYVSDNTNDWGSPVLSKVGNNKKESIDILKENVSGRYVKLEVTSVSSWPSVSAREFQVFLTDEKPEQSPSTNVALNKDTVVSSSETPNLGGDKAVDGNKTDKASRWSAFNKKPSWIYVDLGDVMNVQTIKLYWERRNATNYDIQIAKTLSDEMKESDWTTVKSYETNPSTKDQRIILDSVQEARYVRLKVNNFTVTDPDKIETWDSVSIFEIEVYGGVPKGSISDVLDQIKLDNPLANDKKLNIDNIINNQPEGYTIEFNGADYEQIIDSDLTIYKPLVDSKVNINFKVTDNTTKEYKFKEIELTVPGQYEKTNEDNQEPQILPELREWKGYTGNFTVSDSSKIVINSQSLKETAELFAKDYKEITGKTLKIQVGETANDGDFYFTLSKDKSLGLKDEGNLIKITDKVEVTSETTTGAYWATRTILQALTLNDNSTIQQGVLRDYPLYKVRGFILDVGRKTFTMDYLNDLTNMMSWYKMNDFQVHLNDNYIFLEEYSALGKDPMQAYTGFRLESDIKKGGNNGKNKDDLTSKDVYYTKEEFKKFITDSRARGVNIVPEIDTPAHSLSLTKVRPDLRIGTNGRENDHLNLTDKYDESLEFVQSIFSEYMDGSDPVFDDQTTVHIGADEYTASSHAYRKFVNDMIEFVEDRDRKSRVWGSFTQLSQGEEINADGVEINLWNYGWANIDKMYDDGFDLINCNDGSYYIVPNAGYYYDYLNNSTVYNSDINTISGKTIPAGDEQMVGGAFAVWNDMVDRRSNGVSEYDVYKRIEHSMGLFAANLWGRGDMKLSQAEAKADELGDGPGVDFKYLVDSKDDNIAQYNMDELKDSSSNQIALNEGKNASIEKVDHKNALKLNGKESYVESELGTIGLDNNLRVKVKRTSNSLDEQILFESEYGSIKAVQKESGNVGLSRENHDYSFNYQLPVNEWVELEFKNKESQTSLYVNGELVDTIGDGEKVFSRPLKATMMLPIQYIGSKTKSFIGYIDDVRISRDASYSSTMELDHVVLKANAYIADKNSNSEKIRQLKSLIEKSNKVINNYNPNSSEITQLTNSINEILNNLEYKMADYSRIDIYLDNIPSDLSIYTQESIDRLNVVKNSIKRDLHASLQDVVDGYEKSLISAISKLEVKDRGDLHYLENSKITATASSYQDESSSPAKALDENSSTIWHTKWSNTTMPHTLTLAFDEIVDINEFYYLPRQSGTNGNITKYKLEVSTDGENYTEVAQGNWANNASAKTASFDSVKAKYLRLTAIEAIGNFASAAEVKVRLSNVNPDIEGLSSIINEYKQLENKGYTQETWNAFQEIIKVAEQTLNNENSNANDVEAAKESLLESRLALRLESAERPNYNELKALISKAEKLNEKDYTEKSWEKLQVHLKDAKKVVNKVKESQVQIDKTAEKLKEAIDNLVKVSK